MNWKNIFGVAVIAVFGMGFITPIALYAVTQDSNPLTIKIQPKEEPKKEEIKPEPEVLPDKINTDQMELYQNECRARAKRKLPARIIDASLCKLAQNRANELVKRWGHYNIPSGCVEVIAQNSSGTGMAVEQWRNSETHAKAMFGEKLVGGYGVARDGDKIFAVALYRSTGLDKPINKVSSGSNRINRPIERIEQRQPTRTFRGPFGIFRWRRIR